VRHLSSRATPWIARTSLTPNHLTTGSLLAGIAAGAALANGGQRGAISAGVLLVVSYVLDNCDGEIARLKSLSTRFGMVFDSVTDWLVHAAFFAGLGYGTAVATGNPLWGWLGAAAVLGTTINSALSIPREVRIALSGEPSPPTLAAPEASAGWLDRLVYVLRELSRADFCFLVLALALLDLTWYLLPAAALGAQAYWLLGLLEGARRYHV
jgi:phosphatidylglycerophosphate synthase